MNSAVEQFFSEYIDDFLTGNRAARGLAESLKATGVGLMPLVDHCTLRTLDVDERAKEFINNQPKQHMEMMRQKEEEEKAKKNGEEKNQD